MSISLLDHYERLQSLAQEARKSTEALAHMLKELISHSRFYAKGLERLSSAEFAETESLGAAAFELRSHCAMKAEQVRITADNFSGDLLEPLQTFLAKQTSSLKKAVTEAKTITEEAKQAKGAHDSAYQRYKRTCSELDQVMTRLDCHSGDMEARYSDLCRLMSLRRECWDSAKLYKSSVDQYQSIKQRFDSRMVMSPQPVILTFFENLEKARRGTVKDTLRKLVVFETAWLRNLQYETEKMATVMESVDVDKDMGSVFPAVKVVTIPSVVYRPWVSEEVKAQSVQPEENQSMLARLRRVTGKLFQFGSDEKGMKFIESQVERACAGEEMKLDEEYSLRTMLKDKPGRYFWASSCQKKVQNGPITLPHAALIRLSDQMKIVLHECEKQQETDLPLSLLSTAQKISSVTSDETLQSFLLSISLWKQSWLWERVADSHNLGSHFALQSMMENLGLNAQFIQASLGRYIRKPSLSVSANSRKKQESAKRGVPKWVEDLDCRRPFQVRSSIAISQMIPSLQTDEEDLDPEMSTEHIPASDIREETTKKQKSGEITAPGIRMAQGKSCVVKVDNLSEKADESTLRSFFHPCGSVLHVEVLSTPTSRSAIMEFPTVKEAEKAVSLSGLDLHSRILDVKFYVRSPE